LGREEPDLDGREDLSLVPGAAFPGVLPRRYGMGMYSLLSGKGSVGKLTERHSAKDLFLAVARAYADGLKGIPECSASGGSSGPRRPWGPGIRPDAPPFSAGVREVAFNE